MLWRVLWVRLTAALRPRLGLWDTAVTPFRVHATDLDVYAHMNNGRYLSILDLGRLDLMVRSGLWQRLKQAGWYPVVAGQTITYRRSLELGQRYDVHTAVVGFDDRWCYLEQQFRVDDAVHAHAVIRARFLRRGGGTVDTAELARLAGEIPDHLEVPSWVAEWTRWTRVPNTRNSHINGDE
ncbi:thioesterase family protein [Demequina pelophila]|uniref:thioesterase family protein n=1 Tax=Demequina pelophila TaxID=1638984 RepID=UPI001D0EA8AE|nr:thioesterase family protein [Demequina pelophila]